MKMKSRLVGKLVLGFIVGAVLGDLITIIINLAAKNDFLLATSSLAQSVGTTMAVILQSLLAGIHGLVCFWGTEFYYKENWSLLKATLTHLMCILASYCIVGFILGWIRFDIPSMLTFIAIIIAFFIIWIIMGTIWKRTIREMNSELEQYKKENSK